MNIKRSNWYSAIATMALVLAGCGGEADSNESMLSPAPTASNTSKPTAPCVPGHQNDCQCDDGAEGKQTCAKDGQSYGDCVCIAKPEAGTDSEADAGNDAQPEADNDAGTDAKHECETDQDCAKFNTQCMFFGCLNFMCFETHDTCGTAVNVTLAADTPAGMNVTKNAINVPVVKVNLTANYDATISSLTFHRVGTGATKDIAKAYLFDEYNKTTTAGKTLDPSTDTVQFDALSLTVPSGTTHSYSVYVDFAGDAIGITGGQHAFELQDATSVTLADAGHQVQGSFPVRGNTFTVSSASAGTLKAELATYPVTGTVVKKSQNVEILGIRLTAGANDMLVGAIPLKCQASIHGAPFSATDCWQRITSLAIFDGAQQIGYAMAPNTDGKAPILANHLIPNGSTKTLTVKASFASSASVDEPFDKVSVGLDTGVVATDTVYNQSVAVEVGASLSTQLTQSPTVFFTVLNSGTVSITANGHPASDIVVAGKDSWVPFARYRATGQYEALTIDRISVSSLPGGDNADFVQIGISTGGVIKGASVLPAGITGSVDIDLVGNAIQVPKDGSTDFEVWAKISPTMPSSAVNGAWQGVCRSGHAPALGLSSDKLNGEWTPEYSGKLNVRTTGDKSGERIYATKGAAAGNLMVIRKTKPFVAKQNLANNVLFHGEVELYRAQVGADSMSPVAIKQMSFALRQSGGITLSNFRLYRGSQQVPLGEYSIVDGLTGADLRANSLAPSQDTQFAVAAFVNEDQVQGSGYVYSLRATTSFVGSGHWLMTKLDQDYPAIIPTVKTGYLLQNDAYAPLVASFGIFNVGYWGDQNGLGAWHVRGRFVWSDMSETPHLALTQPSSADWTTDSLIQDLSQNATVSN